jgi:hypothetical protein
LFHFCADLTAYYDPQQFQHSLKRWNIFIPGNHSLISHICYAIKDHSGWCRDKVFRHECYVYKFRVEKTKKFILWQIFAWFTIVLTAIESSAVITTRILYTPGLFGDSDLLKDYIAYLIISVRFFIIPLASFLRSICAVIFTYDECRF